MKNYAFQEKMSSGTKFSESRGMPNNLIVVSADYKHVLCIA